MEPLHILVTTTREFLLWDWHLERIRAAAPNAHVVVKRLSEVTEQDVHAAHVIFGPPRKWVADAPHLRWMQLPSAGADGYVHLRPDVPMTKSSGVFGIPIAEWVIGAILMLTRRMHVYRDQQRQSLWQRAEGAKEIYGSTVGIVGLGDLGVEIARRVRPFGCRVLGARRRPGGALPANVDAVMELDKLLPQVDFLILAVPGTPETNGMLSASRIASMKQGSYLVNVGRGTTVDEEALIEALRSGHLAGAALDVTVVEPLPPESPLWQMEQVIICPHSSGISPEGNADRRIDIFCDNLRRLLAGEPLRNLVDRQAGY